MADQRSVAIGRHSDRNLLVAIDLGNSSASYGIHRDRRMIMSGSLPIENIPKLCKLLAKSGGQSYRINYIVCSVVPYFTLKLVTSLKKFRNTDKVWVVGKNIIVNIPMRYTSSTLGADRLVNVYGARILHGSPCLIVDFGTAITFDYVSRSGVFQGGLIVPGVELSGRALSEKAALLPHLKRIGPVRTLIGRGTRAAMSSGLLNGFGALADGLIERFRREYDRRLKVIATGGFSKRIAPYTRHIDILDPWHTLKSLALVYRREIVSSR